METNTTIIKKLVVVAIVLAIITVSLLAFIGVYSKNLNKLVNVIPDYTYSTEFEGNREFRFALATDEAEKEVYIDSNGNICGEVKSDDSESESTEIELQPEENAENTEENSKNEIEGYTKEKRNIKSNDDSVLNPESYKKSKSIIQKRLDALQVSEYNIRLDEEKGNLVVEIPDNDDANYIYEAMKSEGRFTIVDSETGLELMNNSHLKSSTVGYTGENGLYTIYLQIAFNKEGKEILKDISNKYVEKEVEKTESTENATEGEDATETTETEVVEENATEPEKEIKYVDLMLDDTKIMTTYFGEELDGGELQIPLNRNVSSDDIQNSLKSANAISVLLNNGRMPNKYLLENDNFVKSSISEKTIKNVMIVFASVVLIISVYLIIVFGLNGLLGAIINLGYLGLVSLALRYTSVVITVSALVTMFGMILINFGFLVNLLKQLKEKKDAKVSILESMKKLYLSLIPIIIVAFIFTFMTNASVSSIGMVLFWGILIHGVYNIIFTNSIYVLNESKINIENLK